MNRPSEDNARFASEQLARGCETMEHLLNGLTDSKGRVAEEVHTIRKLGKSLRGGFALFRLGRTSAKEIQAIGRLLSGPRDATSRLSTWTKLAWQGDATTVAAIAGLLDQQTHSAARRPPPATIAWCVERVAAARKNLAELPPEELAERIDGGLKKLRKRMARRCRRLHHRNHEDFHETRKALKAYLGALGFLPDGTLTPPSEMLELPELLGDENDLGTLSTWLDAHGFTERFAPLLWEELEASRHKLRKKAIRDAAALVAGGAA